MTTLSFCDKIKGLVCVYISEGMWYDIKTKIEKITLNPKVQWVTKALAKMVWRLLIAMSISAFATLLFNARARAALLIVFSTYEIFILLAGLVFLPFLYYGSLAVIKFIKTPYYTWALVWFFKHLLLVMPIKILKLPIFYSFVSIFIWWFWAEAAYDVLAIEMRNLFAICVDERMGWRSRNIYQNVMLFACEQYVDPLRLVRGLVELPRGFGGWFSTINVAFYAILFFVISAVLKIVLLVFKISKKVFCYLRERKEDSYEKNN